MESNNHVGSKQQKVFAMRLMVESVETCVKHLLNGTLNHQPRDVKQWSWEVKKKTVEKYGRKTHLQY